ncbi:DNA methylase [Bajunvirus bajun]|uniref:DNA methylase n=1 Tax=Brevundimonas phage vB_BgoS-Bajun TaxID=2948594 RepID=A0A9E7STF8_9CAUD|nr:DNA methylase [Brevundimonas phage vB_BgoS-Bajun]
MNPAPLSDAPRKDPSALGTSGYERIANDFYATPRPALDGLFQIIGDDLAGYIAWEPCVGDGAVSEPLRELVRDVYTSDIVSQNGFVSDKLIDFLRIYRDDDTAACDEAFLQWAVDNVDVETAGAFPITLSEFAALRPGNNGELPSAIITNPPYGKDAEAITRHALHLMQPQAGLVAVLCRHEWDCAKSRSDLFDHPAFAMKITLRHRPRWIADSSGSPRFPYAWFVWDWAKVDPATGISVIAPELRYAR